jgi:hypothetical protein
MKSMKRNEPKIKENDSVPPCEPEPYPYGLRLTLSQEILDKLDLKRLPAVGATVSITAKAEVVATRAESCEGRSERSVELQITDMDLVRGAASMEDAVREGAKDAE